MARGRKRLDPEFISSIKKRYSMVSMNDSEKPLEYLQILIAQVKEGNRPLRDCLEMAARTIYRLFDFQEIAIGLRSERDRLYRYEILLGFTRDAEKALRLVAYTYQDMVDYAKYPGIRISTLSDLCFSEELPFQEGEEDTYNRPLELTKERKSADDFIEGDYLDISILGTKNEFLGWIELSNTKNGKMPSRESIRWLELFSSILGLIIERDRQLRKGA